MQTWYAMLSHLQEESERLLMKTPHLLGLLHLSVRNTV